jgi:dTDP-4-dehydrorhamnose reductase
MRILVTGASGQVGSAVISALQDTDTVVAGDRSILDLSQPESLLGTLDRLAPDVIINAAAYTAVDQAEDEPALAMCVNATAPGMMARWAADRAVPFIHFSTDYVFSGEGQRPWREEDATAPLSVYGASKRAGEQEIASAGGCSLILRTSWIYAAKGKNFLRTMARLASERTELRVVADQIGAPTSAGLLADSVARMLTGGRGDLCARATQAQGVVHISASGAASWHQFASAIVDGLRSRGVRLAVVRVVPISSEDYPTRATRPRNSRLDLRRLGEVFGITPSPWEQDLAPQLDIVAHELAQNASQFSELR